MREFGWWVPIGKSGLHEFTNALAYLEPLRSFSSFPIVEAFL